MRAQRAGQCPLARSPSTGVDIDAGGGCSPCSSAMPMLRQTALPLNDAPVLDNSAPSTLTTLNLGGAVLQVTGLMRHAGHSELVPAGTAAQAATGQGTWPCGTHGQRWNHFGPCRCLSTGASPPVSPTAACATASADWQAAVRGVLAQRAPGAVGSAAAMLDAHLHLLGLLVDQANRALGLAHAAGPKPGQPGMASGPQDRIRRPEPPHRAPPVTTFATWNVNSLAVRLPQLLAWLDSHRPDVLVLQETKLTDDKFPHAEIEAAGWQVVWFGQKTYNGVALLARRTPQDVVRNIPGLDDPQARVIAATVDGVRVIGAYFPNGQAPGTDKFAYKMGWLSALRAWVAEELQRHPRLVLMGDFNIAPDDRDVHDPVAWAGQIHCTDEERAHFQALVGLGLSDAFRLFEQPPRVWSWWDYRNLAFRKNQGLRIDHILVSAELRPLASACVVDKQPRKNERPSDHAPVVLTIAHPTPAP